jgi:dTDP-4-amino-4,6-dideoxygalactose transaminase
MGERDHGIPGGDGLMSGTRQLAIDGGDPLRSELLPFGRPVLEESEIEGVAEVLRSGWLGMGARTSAFEQKFASYVGAQQAVAVSSCTAGLQLALESAGVVSGDEVITTPMTFAATVNVILAAGAKPVLVDVDRQTYNINLELIEAAITSRTRCLLPVHFGGLACDLTALSALATRHGLSVVEDAAHAVGAWHAGTRVGGHGNLASFSFYPNKNMTTIEGGMVTTDDEPAARAMSQARQLGLSSDAWQRYGSAELVVSEVVRPGLKSTFTDVQAQLGLSQLERLEGFQTLRHSQAAAYDVALDGLPLTHQFRPAAGSGDVHALHLYLVQLDLDALRVDRDRIVRALRAENIGVGVHYQAIHEHPYFASLMPYGPGSLPESEWISRHTVTLPLGPSMTGSDQGQVVEALESVLEHYRR